MLSLKAGPTGRSDQRINQRDGRVPEPQSSAGCQHSAVMFEPSASRLFYGTVRVLKPGDALPDRAHVSNDPAEALARAWQEASEGTGTPFLYEVVMTPGRALAVGRDVLIDGDLAGRALDAAKRSSG